MIVPAQAEFARARREARARIARVALAILRQHDAHMVAYRAELHVREQVAQLVKRYKRHEFTSETDIVRLRRIKQEVAKKHKVTVAAIEGRSRRSDISLARREALYRARMETSFSFPELGRRFGDRDHSTVITAVDKFAEELRLASHPCAHSSAAISTGAAPGSVDTPPSPSQDA